MNKEEILNYNCRCAEFLKIKKRTHTKKETDWYLECYPDVQEYREAYDVPLNFPFKYEHPTVIHVLYKNTKKIPVLTERVSIAGLKFHSDWNWIMEVVEAIEKLPKHFTTTIHSDAFDKGDEYKMFIFNNEGEILVGENGKTKKEAVVNTINQFLIWYNENKS